MLLAYLIPTILSVIAVQTWFEPGTVIATGDLPPPIAPASDTTSHWGHLTTGEGAPTSDIANLPSATWLDLLTGLGASEELAQRLWLTALFAGAAAAVVYLAFGFGLSPLAAGSAGLLATFNAYRLIMGPNVIPTAAIIVAAVLGGLVLRAPLRPQQKAGVVTFALASLGLGYVMVNPPHVALVAAWVAACVAFALLMRPNAAGRTLAFLGKALPLALVVNAWWIVPAWLSFTEGSFDDRFIATGVDEWAWTHERSTLGNVLALNTAWGWNYPEYFPYAERFGHGPWNILQYALVGLAVVGVALAWRRDRRVAMGLAAVGVVAALLASGFRGPVPDLNRWLYDNFPGYWLFREPTKLLLLVMLPMALLAGLGLGRLLELRTRNAGILASALVLGALVYVHPMYTGEIIPDDRPLLPSAHVRVPDAWRGAASMINAQPGTGKVLVLPRSDFYQVPTTWGYYGVPFTGTLIGRPVVESRPGGYYRPKAAAAALESSIEQSILRGRPAEARNALAALGVRYILLRRDIDTRFPGRRFAQPKLLAAGLRRIPGVRLVQSFGILQLYRVDRSAGEVFPATPVLYAGPQETLARALIVTPRSRPGFVSEQRDQRLVVQSGARIERLVRYEEDRIRTLRVRRQGGRLRFHLADPFRLTVGGRTLRGFPSESISVPIARNTPVLITAGSAVVPLTRAPARWLNLGLLGLQPNEAVTVWQRSDAKSVDIASRGPVRDCNAFDDRDLEDIGLRASVAKRSGRRTLRLSARAHSACVNFALVSSRSSDMLRVRFRYRQLQGNPARACLWQPGLDRCATVGALRSSRTWRTFDASVRLHPRAQGLVLYLYADGLGRDPVTVTEYQSIRVERYRRATVVPHSTDRVSTLRGTPATTRTLAYAPPPLPAQVDLRGAGPAGDCHAHDARTPEQAGISARVVSRAGAQVLQLAARHHSACVDFVISQDTPPARMYRVQFEYRRLSGNAPRVCLWQEGTQRCAQLSRLQRSSDWRVFDESVELDENVEAVRLFLYADGGGGRRTVTEYRNVHVGPVASASLLGITKERPLPTIVARREEPWKFSVRVEDAKGPFLLATSEGYAPGWKASVEDHPDSELRHVEVNGYANGWLVPFEGSYEMTLEYGPERYARVARVLSLVGILGILGFVGLRRLRAFDKRWHARRPPSEEPRARY